MMMCSDDWGEEQESFSSKDQIAVLVDVTDNHFW